MRQIKLTIILLVVCSINCNGQSSEKTLNGSGKNQPDTCNQKYLGTKKYIKNLPSYICIPDGYVVTDYVKTADLDGDGKDDFLAVRYRKDIKLIDGDTTYWDFYIRNKAEFIFRKRNTLNNIIPPYLKSISLSHIVSNDLAERIFELYPWELINKDLRFKLNNDTIRLSYKYEEVKGKTFVFIYSSENDNWYLENIEYFFGELPLRWWRDDDFYYTLNNQLIVLETQLPKVKISIDQFNLIEAFKYRNNEREYISNCYTSKLNDQLKSRYKTILDYKFEECKYPMELPEDWKY